MVAGNAQIRRSFPTYSDVAVISSAFGNSNYYALNLRLEKRYSSGLHFQTNYTFGKSIDDVASRKSARRVGLSGSDIKHHFVWSSVYEPPADKGKPLT